MHKDVTYKTKESKSLDKSSSETSSDLSTVQAERPYYYYYFFF